MGTAACGGTCIDVTSDPANCGGCGHDCLGAACSAGLCLPETLAVVPNAPAAIALDGDDVVFATSGAITSSGAVYRLPGVGELEVVYHGLGGEAALAVTAGTILVADSGQPDPCHTSSSAGDILAITGDEVTIYSAGRRCAHWLLPVDGRLVWVEEAPLRVRNTGDPGPWIARLPGGASPGDPPAMLYGPRPNGIRDLVQSGDTLIWRESTFSTGELMQMPLEGGAAGSIASVAGELGAHAADAERLAYAWKSGRTSRLVVRTLATGEQRTVAEVEDPFAGGSPAGWRLALDASFVYWIEAGTLWAVDLHSGGRRRLASSAVDLAQDDRFLYALRRIQRGGGPRTEVLRLRKPAALGQSELEPLACRGPLKDCSSDPFLHACVDVRTDPNHCGDCSVTCDPGEVCAGGGCVCNPTSLVCGGACVDPATDKDNCGRCGRSCGGGDCVGGDCKPVQIGERTGI
ncbi:MAG TPA: hypothetical protein VK932_14235, partial [Kofleriaceae bacterium]|nr:hypothetical protein [Kofleriaceae bacterium]